MRILKTALVGVCAVAMIAAAAKAQERTTGRSQFFNPFSVSPVRRSTWTDVFMPSATAANSVPLRTPATANGNGPPTTPPGNATGRPITPPPFRSPYQPPPRPPFFPPGPPFNPPGPPF
ncbi:hypothetical protein [Posidoniimonas polymericola]|nr:hypothetical protein [Posidoniimonas polymericola]